MNENTTNHGDEDSKAKREQLEQLNMLVFDEDYDIFFDSKDKPTDDSENNIVNESAEEKKLVVNIDNVTAPDDVKEYEKLISNNCSRNSEPAVIIEPESVQEEATEIMQREVSQEPESVGRTEPESVPEEEHEIMRNEIAQVPEYMDSDVPQIAYAVRAEQRRSEGYDIPSALSVKESAMGENLRTEHATAEQYECHVAETEPPGLYMTNTYDNVEEGISKNDDILSDIKLELNETDSTERDMDKLGTELDAKYRHEELTAEDIEEYKNAISAAVESAGMDSKLSKLILKHSDADSEREYEAYYIDLKKLYRDVVFKRKGWEI